MSRLRAGRLDQPGTSGRARSFRVAQMLDRDRYSSLAHASLAYASPLTPKTMEPLLDRLALRPGARVLDIGCGKGEVLVRVCERGGRGLGVDTSPFSIDAAHARARARGVADRVEFILSPAAHWRPEPGAPPFDAAVCIGATHAFGRVSDALAALARHVAPGSHVLCADAYIHPDAPDEYLTTLGIVRGDAESAETMQAAPAQAGLLLEAWIPSPPAALEAYETAYREGIERWCDAHPTDPDVTEMRARAQQWWQLFDRLGRHAMGFGTVVARKPT